MVEHDAIRTSAPGRAGIVGNPTDGYGGSVLSSSIAERAWCELRPAAHWRVLNGGVDVEIRSEADLEPRGDYADVARAVLKHFWPLAPAEIRAGTNIPVRAGLSGSTAILTAILAAVLRHTGQYLSRHEIAETARAIEFNILKIVCGFQDQYMIVFGGVNYMDFRGKEPGADTDPPYATVESLPLQAEGCAFLLGHTGVQRVSGTVHKGLRERWIEGDREVVDAYVQVAGLARDAKKAVLRGDWQSLGRLMNENHAAQRDLGGSGEANERLIKAALEGGALGAKLAGAGGGGTIIALCDDPPAVQLSLEEAGAEKVWRVQPSEGLIVEG